MRHPAAKFLIVIVLMVLFGLITELIMHMFVETSSTTNGTFMGRELPPVRVLRRSTPPELLDPSTPYRGVVADGTTLTRGDLWGHFRLDPQLGYTYEANAISKNRWWQSNNLGARSRVDVEQRTTPGRRRVLVFGESFAQ